MSHFSACYSCHAILCNARWSILPFHTRLQVSELLSSGDVAVCQNGAGKVRLFIPASSNTFTLYFFLISSLVKLKEVFSPTSLQLSPWHLCLCWTSIGRSTVYQTLLFLKEFQTHHHSCVVRPGEAQAVCQ